MSWNRGDSTPKKVEKKTGVMRGVIAGAVVVAVVAATIFCFFFTGRIDAPEEVGESVAPRSIVETKPAKASTNAVVEAKPHNYVRPSRPGQSYEIDPEKWEVVNGYVIPKGARLVRSHITNRTERIYKHMTDLMIAEVLTPPRDGMMPPMPPIGKGLEKQFLESLNDPIEIKPTDSERIRRQKEDVMIARVQIAERLKQGESFEEVLSEHWRLTEDNLAIRRQAQKQLDEIFASGDLEGAEKFSKLANVVLSQSGAGSLEEPKTHQQRKAERRERNLQEKQDRENARQRQVK